MMENYGTASRTRADVGKACARMVLAAVVALSGVATANAIVQNRIIAPIRSAAMQTIHGTVHPLVSVAEDQGQLSGSTVIHGMSLVFGRSTAQETDLKQLL
ncbi:MAG: hypothetical protein ABSF34_18110, partial [Verrucomicrobiota bacterium]